MGPTGTWVLRGRHADTLPSNNVEYENRTNFLFLSAVEKFSECCTRVSRQQINETIVDYLEQKKILPCVNAIM